MVDQSFCLTIAITTYLQILAVSNRKKSYIYWFYLFTEVFFMIGRAKIFRVTAENVD